MKRLFSRRDALALLGLSGAALLDRRTRAGVAYAADATVPSCVVRPSQTEGPYFVDERLNRSDIRTDPATGAARPGIPLEVAFRVGRMREGACAPLAGAVVDVWHCDAAGVYSDVRDQGGDTQGQKFLRGYQQTDADGRAAFTTIYPGWYPGRAVHVHFKIRTAGSAPASEFTSQIYFDEAVTDKVHAQAPYVRGGARRLRNQRDGLYAIGGPELTVTPSETAKGYAVVFDVGLQIG